MEFKREYESPKVEIVDVKIESICEWITQSPDSDDFAKEANSFEEEDDDEVTLPIDKNIWEDEEE